ncbi:hypothetical protein HYG81_23335 (plasmid) [Natrinema zhouii]|uniref:hypothetical protein n=1 Tax=Natrinema zhouii TaxID=1710539 RepID=UPI001CFFD36C|nr:hypothetical protein [Natrinema zhouii]UHQ98511.1 hypothetical protein HYG81_23335 [Natrinema zhouii]
MSQPGTTADPNANGDNPSITRVFDVDDAAPYETQRTVQRYLSQETRHNILQVLLGHPSHLASTTELAYYIPRSRSAISDQLVDLADHKIIAQYHHEPNADSRDVPADFWGVTDFGVSLLQEYNYLRGLPIMRAVHDATHKTETVTRHENAPRPALPDGVRDALDYDEPETPTDVADGETTLSELRDQTFYADAAPENAHALNDAAGDRTLDELF